MHNGVGAIGAARGHTLARGGAILSALALTLASAVAQDAPLPGDRQIDAFLQTVSEGKLAEAATMLRADPKYRTESDAVETLSKAAFLQWLGRCRAGIYVNVMFPTAADGTVTRSFHLECQPRGSAASAPYSRKIAFFLESKGDGITVE